MIVKLVPARSNCAFLPSMRTLLVRGQPQSSRDGASSASVSAKASAQARLFSQNTFVACGSIESVADALQYISFYHPPDYLHALAEAHADARPVRVFVQLSARPLYTVSDRQLIGRVLDVCGATNVFGTHGGLTPVVGPEAVVAARPELILSTGGESADDPFAAWRRFPDLPAVAADQLYGLTPDWVPT